MKISPEINQWKKLFKKDSLIVVFAESHGAFKDFDLQKQIIRKFKPSKYIWEMMEEENILNDSDFSDFLKNPEDSQFSIISKYKELFPVVKFIKSQGMQIIGCDLKNMGRENLDFLNKAELTKADELFEEDLINKREERQVEVILNNIKDSKDSIFISLGAYHLRQGSNIIKSLKNNKNVIFIVPFFKESQVYGYEKGMNNENIEYMVLTNEYKILKDL